MEGESHTRKDTGVDISVLERTLKSVFHVSPLCPIKFFEVFVDLTPHFFLPVFITLKFSQKTFRVYKGEYIPLIFSTRVPQSSILLSMVSDPSHTHLPLLLFN